VRGYNLTVLRDSEAVVDGQAGFLRRKIINLGYAGCVQKKDQASLCSRPFSGKKVNRKAPPQRPPALSGADRDGRVLRLLLRTEEASFARQVGFGEERGIVGVRRLQSGNGKRDTNIKKEGVKGPTSKVCVRVRQNANCQGDWGVSKCATTRFLDSVTILMGGGAGGNTRNKRLDTRRPGWGKSRGA